MRNFNEKNPGVLVLLVIILFLFIVAYLQRGVIEEKENLLSSLNSELVTWIDKDGLNRAKIKVITTQNTKAFLALNTRDTIIQELQNSVKEFKKYIKNGGSVTNITNVTEVYNNSNTTVTTDTNNRPIYTSEHNLDGWITGNVIATADSTSLNLRVKNDYTVVVGTEKTGFLKSRDFVEVVNKNPYATTKSLRTYQNKKNVKKFHVGPYIGYGIGSSLIPQVNIGVGVTYSLIRF